MSRFHPLRAMASCVLGMLILLAWVSCGPLKSPDASPTLILIFENDGVFEQEVVVTYWTTDPTTGLQSSHDFAARKVPPGGGESTFVLTTPSPDLINIHAGWGDVALSTELRGYYVARIKFPSAALILSQPAR